MQKRPAGRRTRSMAAVARPRCPTCRSSASTVVARVIRGQIGKLEITCRQCGRLWTASVSRAKHSKHR